MIATPAMRIFLVENHPDTVLYLSRYLRLLGHEVFSAGTIEEALRELPGKNCDLLLSDLTLPDGEGSSLLESLGAARPRFAVAMSGRNTPRDRDRTRAAGFSHYLIKPFLPDELDRVLLELASAESA